MKVTLLGTSCGVPTADRGLPAVAVQREREILLFDCGEGTQRQMMRFGLSFMKVSKIFITHFHGDHYLGLFGLVQSMSFFGRENPLDLYGPPGMAVLSDAFASIGNFRSGFEVRGHDLESGESVGCNGYRVLAVQVDHLVPTLGYALEEDTRPGKFDLGKAGSLGIPEGRLYKDLQQGRAINWQGRRVTPEEIVGPPRPGRRVVYFGDVLPSEAAVSLSRGADLLICEATFCEDLSERAIETGHSTVKRSCQMAREAKVMRLVLTHFSPRYNAEAIKEEIDLPRTVIGKDGLTLEVRYR